MMLEMIFVAAGWVGVLVEFLRPGLVLPGVAGALLLIFGYTRLLPGHAEAAIGISAPFVVATAWLLTIAWRARRNKRVL